MGAVLSVQRHSITLASGVGSNTADLTGTPATDTSDCIPFVTARVSTPMTNADEHRGYAVDAYFTAGSPNKVTVETGNSSSPRAVVVEVTVVEFDSSAVKIQQGTFQITGTSHQFTAPGDHDTLAAVDRAFVYHTWQCDYFHESYKNYQIRGNLFSTTSMQFSRLGSSGTIDGHWYIAEALAAGDPFQVEHLDMELIATETSDTVSLVSIGPVDMSKTFLLGSHKSNDGTDSGRNNADHTMDMYLSSTTQVTITRAGSVDSLDGVVQIVEFNSGGNGAVQRGTWNEATADGDESIDITDLGSSLSEAMVHSSAATGSFTSGSFPGTTSADDPPDAHCAMSFVDSDTIRIQHGTGGGEDNNDISWETIVWSTTAAPTRRVMVVG